MKEIKFKFDNDEAAQHFLSWLCDQGEQDYWLWMEYREEEEKTGDITVTNFDYWDNDNKKFGEGDIVCTCSRLDKGK